MKKRKKRSLQTRIFFYGAFLFHSWLPRFGTMAILMGIAPAVKITNLPV